MLVFGGVFVLVFLWWCLCGGVCVVVFLWWCLCGGVFVVVFLWCSCGGVFVVGVGGWGPRYLVSKRERGPVRVPSSLTEDDSRCPLMSSYWNHE